MPQTIEDRRADLERQLQHHALTLDGKTPLNDLILASQSIRHITTQLRRLEEYERELAARQPSA